MSGFVVGHGVLKFVAVQLSDVAGVEGDAYENGANEQEQC
jgi:hypothetical protein